MSGLNLSGPGLWTTSVGSLPKPDYITKARSRLARKPIAVGPVGRDGAVTVEWWKYAQSLTKAPVKGMLTGPYTICDWSFNEHYATRRDYVLDLAKVIRDEALDLEKAGARFIQIDEPAASTRMDELDLVI